MEVYKAVDTEATRFDWRYLTVVERCRLMGVPEKYIDEALAILFTDLSYAHSFT